MNAIPQPAWACVLAILGAVLAAVVLMHPDPQTISLGVLAVASNLVSGALGAFAGHITSAKNPTTPVDPAKEQ